MRAVFLIAAILFSHPALADYALVFNGGVAQVEARPFPVAPGMTWIKVPDGVTVQPGWTYDGMFKPPKDPPQAADVFERSIANDMKFKALVRALAEDKGKTEQQIIDWLKSKL